MNFSKEIHKNNSLKFYQGLEYLYKIPNFLKFGRERPDKQNS